ncbi:hypothetical protein HG537_0A06320 [Torulaspora globosa]|uniref:TECPR1-like DysF domain-containing protein n=1 Tax=Torulaspora globosa TaxID=48254 RepID=A0A7H9HPV4_9SACH|nr:hypothetical protein HG537_0A06320 [Torulaspora sp. CBS 2947]
MESVTSFFWHEGQKVSGSSVMADKRGSGKEQSGKGSNADSGIPGAVTGSGSSVQKLMTDTLIEKIMKMALPPTTEMGMESLETRIASARERPNLSVQIMSRNFVLMNSRLSLPFTMIDEVNKIFAWSNPAYTISIVLIYSYVVLKPIPTITSIPIFYLLFGVMVPQFLYIHKPDGSPFLDTNMRPAEGPPLRKAELPKPVPELSQEFILNLTDLQNRLLLYVKTYDFLNAFLAKFAFFTDEKISSVAFVLLLLIGLVNTLFMDFFTRIVPIKATLLLLGWSFAILMHPHNRDRFFSTVYSEETRLNLLALTNRYEKLVNEQLRYMEAREHRMVAVYEIQRFRQCKEWVPVGYSSDDFTLFSKLRISQQRIEDHCAQSLDEVKPPVDWDWLDGMNWALNLDPTEWLEDGFVEYVDVDLGTKWVYDLNLDGTRGGYRRRMWTNLCVRKIEFESEVGIPEDSENPTITSTKPETIAPRVTRGSMSGSIYSDDNLKAGRPNLKKSNSNLSVNSQLSTANSIPSLTKESSKAIDSLTNALNCD